MSDVKVYGSEVCLPCKSTRRFLENNGVKYEYFDVSKDPDAAQVVMDLGYNSIPVIVTADNHWVGFNIANLTKLVSES